MKQVIFCLCDKDITKIGNAATAAKNAQKHPCPQCRSQKRKLGLGKSELAKLNRKGGQQ